MNVDFSRYRLDDLIACAAKAAFGAALAENPSGRFFAFALTTLSDAQYIECSLNSEMNLRKLLARAGADGAEQELYYKWHPGEWGEFEYYGQQTRDFFRPVEDMLARIGLETADFFDVRKQYVLESMLASLESLDAQGFFGAGSEREQRIVFADIYDDEASETMRMHSIQKINRGRASPALIDEFRQAG